MEKTTILMEAFKDWQAIENKRVVNNTNYCSDYEIYYKDILVATYGYRKCVYREIELLKNNSISETLQHNFIEKLKENLKEQGDIQFTLGEHYYEIFKSMEEGYIYNIYPNNVDLIFDGDGELIEDEQLDGGLCSSDNIEDVFTFII